MSRPPSARPKTSAGRAQSAARQRPQTASRPAPPTANGTAPKPARPESRSSVTRVPTAEPPRLASRAGLPAPRVPTAPRAQLADRPMSGATMRPISSAARPITQQGLTGIRAASRAGTGSQRHVYDKSYYIAMLRHRIATINAEIGRLRTVAAKGERDRNELAIYEKQAEESALAIRELQGKLADLNMVVERMHTNSELGDIELEAREVRGKADQVSTAVEQLFADRRGHEGRIEQILAELDEQRRLNQAVIASMDPTVRDRYDELQRQAAALRDEMELKESEMKDIENKRLSLEQELQNSPLKQRAIELRERLLELREKERVLKSETEDQESPEDKKAKLLAQVRKNNEEAGLMQKQLDQVLEQVETAQEELREFDNEIDVLTGEQNARYLALKRQEQQMGEFLGTFEEQKRLSMMELEELSEAVVQNLKRIATNIAKVNMGGQVTGMDPAGERGEFAATSAKELKEVHIRLQEEMITLNEMEEDLRSEMEAMNGRIGDSNRQMEQFGDRRQLEQDVRESAEQLETRQQYLEAQLPEVEGHQVEMSDRKEALERRLDTMQDYQKLLTAQKRLEAVARDTAEVRANFERNERETNYGPVKEKALRLQKEYNEVLVALSQNIHPRVNY